MKASNEAAAASKNPAAIQRPSPHQMMATATTNTRPSSLRGSCSGKARAQNGCVPSMAAAGPPGRQTQAAAAAATAAGGGCHCRSTVVFRELQEVDRSARASSRRPAECEPTPRQNLLAR